MKKLCLLMIITLLLLSACRPQEQEGGTAAPQPQVSQPIVENNDALQPDEKEKVPAATELEGIIIKVEEGRVLLRADTLPVSDKIYVRIDERMDEPLPELREGYRIKVKYSGTIADTLLPQITADAIYFLEDMGEYSGSIQNYPQEKLTTPQNTVYPSKSIKEYARFYREVFLGERENGHLSHLKSYDQLTELWGQLESGSYDGYGNAIDHSEVIADYTPTFFKKNDLLVVYISANGGGIGYGLYDIVVEKKVMTVQIVRTDLPCGTGGTTGMEERLILIQVPKETTKGVSESKVQIVYGDETSVVAKENGRIIVDAEKYSIQQKDEIYLQGYYCAFASEDADSLQVGERVMIVHTGTYDDSDIPSGHALSIIGEGTV